MEAQSPLTSLATINPVKGGNGPGTFAHVNCLRLLYGCNIPAFHPLRRPEIRSLRKLQRDYPDTPYVFVTGRREPLTSPTVRKLVTHAGKGIEIGLLVHPHMLRHACGYKPANEWHDTRSVQHYLVHRNIQHIVKYTELAPDRFKSFWND